MRPRNGRARRNFKKEPRHLINFNIKSPKVRCIDLEGNCDVIPTQEALKIAEEAELDLVQISKGSDYPTCKIIDYSKFKYELDKKEKAAKKKRERS